MTYDIRQYRRTVVSRGVRCTKNKNSDFKIEIITDIFYVNRLIYSQNINICVLLDGPEKLDSTATNLTEEEIVDTVGTMGSGGSWAPEDCKARHSVCIIIPYRDRRDHLWALLHRLIPVLKRQQLDFKIFVVEQVYMCPTMVTLTYYYNNIFDDA